MSRAFVMSYFIDACTAVGFVVICGAALLGAGLAIMVAICIRRGDGLLSSPVDD